MMSPKFIPSILSMSINKIKHKNIEKLKKEYMMREDWDLVKFK